ncbi:MAG: hypothetical protein V4497_01345 [Bacteroidota bacterium]
MIVGFSTQLNGKPTYFVEKIWKGLLNKHANLIAYNNFRTEASINNVIDQWDYSKTVLPKIHTIRDDINDRWQEDMKIDFFINVRTKNMFRFAPTIPVVSTQEILMTYAFNDLIQISIDDRELFGYHERLQFAINDGFDSWEDFFDYFLPKIKAAPKGVYKPKLIHWTGLKY